jgi:hypothetical protein
MKQLMFSLFYPAILGTLLYDILLAGERANWLGRLVASDHKLLIAGLLVLHFVFDFIFTQEVDGYKASVFVVDIAIVVLLFVAYNGVHLNDPKAPLDVERVAASLCGTYLCFLLWGYLMRAELGFQLDLFIYELVTFIVVLVSMFFGLNAGWLACFLIAATIAMGLIGNRILKRYHAPGLAT